MTARSDARWSVALLAVAVTAALAVMMPWARGLGSVVPDSMDPSDAELARPGEVVELSGRGLAGVTGAVLLALACVLFVVALWRSSPRYRPVVAGYAAIVGAAVAAATVLWFVVDDTRGAAVFGSGVDVQTDSVRLTAWPWITLGCFAVGIVVGVLLVPRAKA